MRAEISGIRKQILFTTYLDSKLSVLDSFYPDITTAVR